MISKSQIVIIVVIVVIAVAAIVVGVVLGTRSNIDCGYVDAPSELKIEKNVPNTTISWFAPEQADNCYVTYTIHYSVDNNAEEKYNTTNLFYHLPLLDSCSVLSVHVWARSESGELSEEDVHAEYTESLTEVPPVTDVAFTPTADGVVLSYTKPEGLEKCNLEYNILVTTDTGIINSDEGGGSLTITEDKYCFEIEAEITVSADEINSSPVTGSYSPVMVGVQNIQVSENSNQLTVSWTEHPKAELCSLDYRVVYSAEGEDDIPKDTDTTTTTFDVVHCVSATVSVTAFKPGTGSTSQSSTVSATSVPGQIEKVTDLVISKIDDSLIVTWTPAVIEPCTPKYLVSVLTQVGTYEALIDEVTYEIPSDKFCTKVQLQVSVVVAGITGEPETASETVDMEPIEDLQILDESYILTATWAPHAKQDICSLRYRVVYSVDGEEDVMRETATSTTDFETIYCSSAEVSVTAFNVEIDATTEPILIDAIQYPSEIDAVTGLILSYSIDSLTASWAPVIIGTCIPRYVISGLTDIGNLGDLTYETSYIIPEDRYCTIVQLQVIALIGELEGHPDTASETFVLRGVSNLQTSISSNELTATWSSHPKQILCNIEYRAVYSVENEADETITTSTTEVAFTYIPAPCANPVVYVTPFIGLVDGQTTYKNVIEPSEIGKVTNLEIAEVDGNLVVSWTPVEIAGCTLMYLVSFTTDIDSYEQLTGETTFDIPQNSYCTNIQLQVRVQVGELIGEPETVSKTVDLDAVTGLQVSDESSTLTVSWTEHPKETLCSLNYRVVYDVEGEIDMTDDTATSTITFNTIYCGSAEISVTAHNIANSINSAPATIDATQFPSNIERVTDLVVSEVDDDLVVTWLPVEIGKCTPNYVIEVTTDTGSYDSIETETTHVIAGDGFCTRADLEVYAVIEGVQGDPEHASKTVVLRGVSDLQTSISSNELTATWSSHPKQVLCNIEYRAVYSVENEADETIITSGTEAVFTYTPAPCTNPVVSVTPFTGLVDGDTTSENVIQPSEIGKVTNLEISEVDGNLVVSWTPVEIAGCTLMFLVSFTTDIDSYEQLTGQTTFDIPQNSYCSNIELQVRVQAGELIGEAETVSKTVDLDTVTGLQVSDESSTLTVSWTEHPKENLCSLNYRVLYDVEGEIDMTDDTATSTVTFNTIYCSSAEISVIAHNIADSINSAPATIDATQFPSNIERVTNLLVSEVDDDLMVTWLPVEIGKCTTNYVIDVTTDTGSYNRMETETTHVIAGDGFCTRADLEVFAVIEGVQGDPEYTSKTVVLRGVSDLQTSISSNELTATWSSHPKQILCNVEYRVVYSVENEEDQTTTTSVTEVVFTYIPAPCTNPVVSVTPFIGLVDGETTYDNVIQPPEIGKVTNLEISEVDGNLVVSWTPVEIAGCTLMYLVSFTTDIGPHEVLIEETTFDIPQNSYCRNIQLQVSVQVGELIGEPETVSKTVDLDAVTGLQVSDESSTLTVSWTEHPKETLCSLNYRVLYDVEGEIDMTDDTATSTVTFSTIYCSSAEISVIAHNIANSIDSAPATIDATQFPSNIERVTDLVVSEVDGDLMVTWLPVEIGKCTTNYVIDVTTDTGSYNRIETETTHVIAGDGFCTRADLQVFAVIEGMQGDPEHASKTVVLRGVSNLQTSISSNELTASWSSHPKQTLCNIEYRAVYRVENEEDQTITTSITEVVFTYIPAPCANPVVYVTPFIGLVDGDTTNENVIQPFEIGKVTNLEISEVDGNLVVSWTPVEIAGCTLMYLVSFTTDIGPHEVLIEETTFDIPQNSYCRNIQLQVSVQVGELIGEPETVSKTVDLDAVTGLQVSDESSTLTVSWTEHPKETLCSLNYRVLYDVEGEIDMTDDTATSTVTFNTIYCGSAEISVTAHNIANTINSAPATIDATQFPSNIGRVTDLIVSEVDDDLVVTWLPVEIGKCTPNYVIYVTTDTGSYDSIETETTHVIAGDGFCTRADLQVFAVIGEVQGDPEFTSKTVDMKPIGGLQVLDESYTLTATWTSHPKQDLCSLSYRVVYSVDGEEDVMKETALSTIDFDTIYCSNAQISVTAFTAGSGASSEPTLIDAMQYPSEIDTVTGLIFSYSSDSLTASWAPVIIGTCIPRYVISGLTDIGDLGDLTYETSYIIPEDRYCTIVQLQVIAVIGELEGNPGSVTETFDMKPIGGLQVFDESYTLTATWTSHPKQDLCSLMYRVVYSVDGEEDVMKETALSTIDFDTIYCSNAQISVTAFTTGTGASTEPTLIDAMQDPSEIDTVTGLILSYSSDSLTASWAPVIIGTCTPRYAISGTTDIGDLGDFIYGTSYIIPEDKYCTRVQLQVIAVIGELEGNPGSVTETFDMKPIGGLQVFDESYTLTATWTSHPKQDLCSLMYRVVYSVDGEEDVMKETALSTIDFDTIYCSNAQISVTALTAGTGASSEPTLIDAMQNPSEIDTVTGLILSYSSNTLTASWAPVIIGTCTPRYAISGTTDIGDLGDLIYETSYIIPEDKYCIRVQLQVIAVIGELEGNPGSVTETFDLQSVSNLDVEVLSDELRAFWNSHPKQDICDLEYIATYSVQNESPVDERVSSPEAFFSLTYCADASVSVVAVRLGSTSPPESVDATQAPTTIGELQTVDISVTDTATISWELPDNMNQCSIEHRVTAINDANTLDEETCTGITSCTVTLDDFCPSTTFIIQATSITGPENQRQHICT